MRNTTYPPEGGRVEEEPVPPKGDRLVPQVAENELFSAEQIAETRHIYSKEETLEVVGNLNGKRKIKERTMSGRKLKELPEILLEAWLMVPQSCRTRSSKAKVLTAWNAISDSDKPSEIELHSALSVWCQSRLWTKDGGQYVKGLHRWIQDRNWLRDTWPDVQKNKSEFKADDLKL